MNNRDYYDKVSEKCFERAKKYDINITVNKYLNLYKELLNE